MARRSSSNGNASEKQTPIPVYHVVRVHPDGETLTIVARDVPAKTHDLAMDATVDSLPPEQRNGKFGAFTVRNYKTEDYSTETEVVTRRSGKRVSSKGTGTVTEKKRSSPAGETAIPA